MSNLLARILLSIMMFPLAIVVYAFSVFFVGEATNAEDTPTMLAAGVVLWAFVLVYWIALWRRSVKWTPTRGLLTVVSAFLCIMGGGVLGAMVAAMAMGPDESFVIFMASVVGILLWVTSTILIWKETAEERGRRVQQSRGDALFCPTCGYNLTGLGEARCPECGTRFTLDQLFASQVDLRNEIADAAQPEPIEQ